MTDICLWAKCPNFRDGEWVPTAEGRSISGHWPSEDLRTELTPEEANEAFVYVNRDTTPVVERLRDIANSLRSEEEMPKEAEFITADRNGTWKIWDKWPVYAELDGTWCLRPWAQILLSGHEPDLANDGSVHNIIWI